MFTAPTVANAEPDMTAANAEALDTQKRLNRKVRIAAAAVVGFAVGYVIVKATTKNDAETEN